VRVNTLGFKRTSGTAKMEIKVSSVAKAKARAGFLSGLKGAIANMIMKAPEIDGKGNQVMLDFGHALLSRQQSFTFPRAGNLMTGHDRT
jgi:hypothetical protein